MKRGKQAKQRAEQDSSRPARVKQTVVGTSKLIVWKMLVIAAVLTVASTAKSPV
jgi:hypothetical protein